LLKSLELVMLGETFLPQAALPFFLGREDEASRGAGRRLGDELPADRIWSPGSDPTPKFEVGDKLKCTNDNGSPTEPERRSAPRLSAQEARILRCLTEGCSNKVIARAVEIADATVKVHVRAIMRKIGVTNRTQVAMWAMHNPPPKTACSPAHNPAAAQPTPPRDAGPVEGDSYLQPPCAEWPAAGHAVEEATGSLKVHKAGALGYTFFGGRMPPAERRTVEEEERLADLTARTSHLRELRQARETAEREALDINAQKDAMIAVERTASNDERSSPQSRLGLA
jgi:DNA-binding CsgD family transcriptional regulator